MDIFFWIAVVFLAINAIPAIVNWADTFLKIKGFFSQFFYDSSRNAVVHPSEIYLIQRKRLYSFKEYEMYSKKIDKIIEKKVTKKEEKEKYMNLRNYWSELQQIYNNLNDLALQMNNDFITGKKPLVKLKEEWEEKSEHFGVYSTKEEEVIINKVAKLNPNYYNEMRSIWGFGY